MDKRFRDVFDFFALTPHHREKRWAERISRWPSLTRFVLGARRAFLLLGALAFGALAVIVLAELGRP
jgi:hypothetical protein